MSQRQFIMGSPVATLGFAAGSTETVTITASEPGVLHADTLCVQAGQDGPGPIPSPGIIQNLQVTSILAYNDPWPKYALSSWRRLLGISWH